MLRSGSTVLLFVLFLLSGCRTAPLGFEVSADETSRGRLTVDERTIEAIAEAGRLTVNGKDYGTVTDGDWVTVDWDGTIRVNHQRRAPTR